MSETLATTSMAAGSFLLFAYWFRYVCRLILAAKPPRDSARKIALMNELAFPRIQVALCDRAPLELTALKIALDRDYQLLVYLLKHTVASQVFESVLERGMLQIYYRVEEIEYLCAHRLANNLARQAVENMTVVVTHFATSLGEQLAPRFR